MKTITQWYYSYIKLILLHNKVMHDIAIDRYMEKIDCHTPVKGKLVF